MAKEMIQVRDSEKGEIILPVLRWTKEIQEKSLVPPRNVDSLICTATEAVRLNCPIPIIISLCPAITNLPSPNKRGQTRQLGVLSSDNPRLTRFVDELFEFNRSTLNQLGVPVDIMMVFADVLERGSTGMFVNVDMWQGLASKSAKEITRAFANLDQTRSGEFQQTKFKTPKVRLQSGILEQAGKVNLRHEEKLGNAELSCLDPNSPMFELFIKHLKLTGETPFVATGFQTIKSAEAVWARVRFMLAQCVADGIVLPKMMREFHQRSFPTAMPAPIFICSTTRPGGIELEMDGFTLENPNATLAIFNNIGSWNKK